MKSSDYITLEDKAINESLKIKMENYPDFIEDSRQSRSKSKFKNEFKARLYK